MSLSQVSSGLVYADVGDYVLLAAVTPPAIDGNVQYTALIHDQNTGKDPTGMYDQRYVWPIWNSFQIPAQVLVNYKSKPHLKMLTEARFNTDFHFI